MSTNLYATADHTGPYFYISPLKASKGGAGMWGTFQFINYNGEYIFKHAITEMTTKLKNIIMDAQADGTLVDNNFSIDESEQWSIV